MDHKGPLMIDTSKVDANRVREVKRAILDQTTKWLFGLEKSANLLTEALFMLVPYSDTISGTKMVGQAHVMFKGGTGIGKTDLAQSVAKSFRATFRRISATPDLMPFDILGGQVLVENRKGERRVQFKPGPIFAHVFLDDEANRMNPKTVSAMLEAMEERSVTPKGDYIDDADHTLQTLPLLPISGDIHDLVSPRFFWVLLTENIFGEEEGVYANPMAQVDRITLTIPIERPVKKEEKKIRVGNVDGKSIEQVSDLQEILACAHWINKNVKTSEPASDYLTQLLRNTDPNPKVTDPRSKLGKFLKQYVKVGASPRVNFHLEAAARARAFFAGSLIVRPEHVKSIAPNVITHRLLLTPGKEFKTPKEDVVDEILSFTDMPKWN